MYIVLGDKMKNVDKIITKYLVVSLIILVFTVIAYPVYKTTNKENEKKDFTNNVDGILAEAKEYYSENSNFNSDYVVFTIENGKVVEEGFDYNGILPDSGKILINKNGDVQIVANDKNWCATKRYSDDTLSVKEYSKTCEVIEAVKFGNINVVLSATGDGIYQNGEVYSYRGSNPNNFVRINDLLFRIVSIDESKNIKLISNDVLYNQTWNIKSINNTNFNILNADNIAYYLNNMDTSNEKFDSIRKANYLLEYNWNTAKFNYKDEKAYEDLKQEDDESTKISATVGLITAYEYNSASINSECKLDSLRNDDCGNNNYLNISDNYFTISASDDSVWAVSSSGKLYETSLDMNIGIRPVIVLESNVKLSGKGTIDNPYELIKNN